MTEEAKMSSDLESTSPTAHHAGEDQADVSVQTEVGDANHGLDASEQGNSTNDSNHELTDDSNAAVDVSSVVTSGQQAAIDETTDVVADELVVKQDAAADRTSNGSAAAEEQGKTIEDSNQELSEDADAAVDASYVDPNVQRSEIDVTTNVEEKVVVESDGAAAVDASYVDPNVQRPEIDVTTNVEEKVVVESDGAADVSSVEPNGKRAGIDVTTNVEDKVVVESDGAADHMSNGSAAEEGVEKKSELKKDAGSRTFTMRELLDELKKGEDKTGTAADSESEKHNVNSPSFGQGGSPHQQNVQNNNAMELINSVTGTDEEGRSRQRVLTYAAKRYASTIERNPEDYDALYNWALVLQESADNVGSDSTSPSKDALLDEACKKYDEATSLCPTLHDAFYNWAIAVSDRAKMRGRTKEAEELWKQATEKYEKAVQLNWNSPQALNNWGLALQELSAIVPAREKQTIVKSAISKFRAAIQLQFDFHRAIYNLGTVLYGLAEDLSRLGATLKDVSPTELYSQSAIYIAAAHSLKPSYSVYTSALKLVRSMLPLPYLKVGYLTAPPIGVSTAPHSDWKRTQFVLNHEGLLQVHQAEEIQTGRTQDTSSANKHAININVVDIVSMSACADLTLPPGAGLCINTTHGSVFLVADSWDSLDGWVDAIRLVYTIFARGKSDILAGIITS